MLLPLDPRSGLARIAVLIESDLSEKSGFSLSRQRNGRAAARVAAGVDGKRQTLLACIILHYELTCKVMSINEAFLLSEPTKIGQHRLRCQNYILRHRDVKDIGSHGSFEAELFSLFS